MTTNIQNTTSVTMPKPASSDAQRVAPSASADRSRQQPAPESGKSLPLGAAQDRPQESPARADVERAVEMFTERAATIGRDLLFEIDDESGETVIKVIDPETEEIVRQIPSEEAVERARGRGAEDMNLIDDSI